MKLVEILKIFLGKAIGDENAVDYVCGSGDALPLPLSPEEEGAALRQLLDGEEKEVVPQKGVAEKT